MILYADLDTRTLVSLPGYTEPLRTLVVCRGDKHTTQLKFVRDGLVVDPGTPSALAFTVKTAGNFDQDPPLVLTTTFTKTGTGTATVFTGLVDYDNIAVAALVGSAETGAAMAEVSLTLGAERIAFFWVPLTVRNVVNRDELVAGPGVAGGTGVDATITTEAELGALVTSNLTVPVVKVWVLIPDLTIQLWVLRAGTDATAAGSVRRPDDYHATTNAKVWYRAG